MIEQSQLDNWFQYHAPTPEQVEKYSKLRDGGKLLAEMIVLYTPPCADQTAVIRLLREALMTANAAIACGGK